MIVFPLPRGNLEVSPLPLCQPQMRGNFFNIHPRKKLFNINDLEFDFRMSCIPAFLCFYDYTRGEC